MRLGFWLGLVGLGYLLIGPGGRGTRVAAQSTAEGPAYSRKNSFEVFGEYSNTSSHILLGQARDRRLGTLGLGYSHRLLLNRRIDLQYQAEWRPVVMESDPVVGVLDVGSITFSTPNGPVTSPLRSTSSSVQVNPCVPNVKQVTLPPEGVILADSYTATTSCSRVWNFAQGLSPAGLKLNFFPRHRIQPLLSWQGGYLFSTTPIPVADAGSFNFTVEFGAGLEFYRSRERTDSWLGNRTLRVEYRIHHFSNAYSAAANPGVDNGLVQLTYTFGR